MPASQPANFNLQEFTDAGLLLVGGRLYTYAQGTTTQKTAYTDPAGSVPQTYTADGIGGQYIALNARGELPTPLYLADGSYDICLKRADGSTAWTRRADGVDSGTNALATSGGSSMVGFIQAAASAVSRTVQDKLRDTVNAQDYSTLSAAFAASDTVLVTSANYPVTTSYTIPKSKTLVILAGGSLNISGGATLTALGLVQAAATRVFNGAGAVVGIRQVYPEWWGALGDGTGDDQPAFTLAHTCVMASSGSAGQTPTIFLSARLYQLANTWTITPNTGISISVVGLGRGSSWLTPSATFPAGPVMLVDGNSAGNDVEFNLRHFGIIATTNGIGAATAGLQIGSEDTTKKLSSTNPNVIENLYVSGFPKCYYVVHARMIEWYRVSGWNNTLTTANTALFITQKGAFTGDMTFEACQFVGNITNTSSTTISIISAGGVATAQGAYTVSGIRFSNTIIYQSAKQLYMSGGNGAILNDIWFGPGCQFDGGSTNAVYIQSNDATTIVRNINITGAYFSGPITGDIISLIGGGGRLTDCGFTGNFINGSPGRSFTAFSINSQVSGIVFAKNRLTENNNQAGPAIEISGPISNFSIEGNIANRYGGNFFKYFITIQSGATQFNLLGNNSGAIGATAAVNDLSGAVIKAVANNI